MWRDFVNCMPFSCNEISPIEADPAPRYVALEMNQLRLCKARESVQQTAVYVSNRRDTCYLI